MVIAPVIFCTVVVGIASMDSLRKVGRVGLKVLVYFEDVEQILAEDEPEDEAETKTAGVATGRREPGAGEKPEVAGPVPT